jgi:hypothetical protein
VRKILQTAQVIGEVEVAEVREMVIRKRQEVKAKGGEGAAVKLPLERFKVTENKEAMNIKTTSTNRIREKAKARMAAQEAYAHNS